MKFKRAADSSASHAALRSKFLFLIAFAFPCRVLELERDTSPFTLPVTVVGVCAVWARYGFVRLMAALAARPVLLPWLGRVLGADGPPVPIIPPTNRH